MNKKDLKFLIDSFLYKMEKQLSKMAFAVTRESVNLFLEWCIANNLLED